MMGQQILVLEFGAREDLPLRIGVLNASTEAMGVVAPLAGGVLATLLDFPAVFFCAIAFKLAAAALVVLALGSLHLAGAVRLLSEWRRLDRAEAPAHDVVPIRPDRGIAWLSSGARDEFGLEGPLLGLESDALVAGRQNDRGARGAHGLHQLLVLVRLRRPIEDEIEGDRVRVESKAGAMTLRVAITAIRPGNVAAYYPEANVLVPREVDPRSRTPAFKSVLVELVPESPSRTHGLHSVSSLRPTFVRTLAMGVERDR